MADTEFGNYGPLWLHSRDFADKVRDAEKVLAGIDGGLRTALFNSVDRAATAGRQEAARLVDEEYTINQAQFKKHTKINRSVNRTDESYSVNIEYLGHVLPVLEFEHNIGTGEFFVKPREDMGGGDIVNRAFVARMYGRYALWERIDKKHVKGLYGPSTAHMMDNPIVSDAVEEREAEVFEERFDHEVLRLLNGWGVK